MQRCQHSAGTCLESSPMGKPQRAIVYVDGLNLHNGLLKSGLPRWVDLIALGRNVLGPGQELTGVRYFTSRLIKRSKDRNEQAIYLEAVEAQGVEIVLGRFGVYKAHCPHCGKGWLRAEEKQTDVNIASRLLADAHRDQYDRAVVFSADSDLLQPVLEVPRLFPGKRVVVGFPPGRLSQELRRRVPSFWITNPVVRRSLLPATVATVAGRKVTAPPGWL